MGNHSSQNGRGPRQLSLFEESSGFDICNVGSEDYSFYKERCKVTETIIGSLLAMLVMLLVWLSEELSGYFTAVPWNAVASVAGVS